MGDGLGEGLRECNRLSTAGPRMNDRPKALWLYMAGRNALPVRLKPSRADAPLTPIICIMAPSRSF
jgi:hypothetical protein